MRPWACCFLFLQSLSFLACKREIIIQTVLNLQFFWLYDGAKIMWIQEKLYWEFWFLLFSRLMIWGMTLSWGWAGQQPQLSISHLVTRANNQYTDNYCVPRQPFCFSLSVQYSINYMRYSTLYYKIDFVLDDFAQL